MVAGLTRSSANAADAQTLHHNLQIRLFPNEQRLSGFDRTNVNSANTNALTFYLSDRTSVHQVEVNERSCALTFQDGLLRVSLIRPEQRGAISVTISYENFFEDPLPIMFLSADNPSYGATGVVSEQGCFLQSGAGRYPVIAARHATYRLCVNAPVGMLAVSAGRCL